MGCLTVKITPNERSDVEFSRIGGNSVCFVPIKKDFSVGIGLVCSVGVGQWEFLACSDLGFVRTYDKGFILVPKR